MRYLIPQIPFMSTKTAAESLFGRIRRELLCLFFMNSGRSFFLLELVSILRTGRGGVQRELANLVESGIITRERSNKKVLFSLSENCPAADEIKKLLDRLVDYEEMLSPVLSNTSYGIKTAVVSEVRREPQTVKLLLSCEHCDGLSSEIERIELLTGTTIEVFAVQPSELRQFISNGTESQWIKDREWKLLAGEKEDLAVEEYKENTSVNEPDLFSGTGFNW